MSPPTSSSADVRRVLEQFAPAARRGDLTIHRIGHGAQAVIHVVRSRDSRPVWRQHHDLVIKMYKPGVATNQAIVRSQFETLGRLHSILNGSTINGWRVHSPIPLYMCVSPLALVMTLVPGRSLSRCLAGSEDISPGMLNSISETVISAAGRFWSLGEPYGDLNSDNVLCNLATRDLSFVDLGMPVCSPSVDRTTKQWYPACHDLGYLLHETASAVLMSVTKPRTLCGIREFTVSLFNAFLKTIGPVEERETLLDEAGIYARAYLSTLQFSWSARGAWRLFLRPIVAFRLDALLGALKEASSQMDEAD